MNAKFVCVCAETVLRKSGQVTINMCSLSKLLFIWDYMHEFFRKERISGATNPGATVHSDLNFSRVLMEQSLCLRNGLKFYCA